MSELGSLFEKNTKQYADLLSRLKKSEQQEDGLKQSGLIEITNWLNDPSQTVSVAYNRLYPSPVKEYAVVATDRGLIAVAITGGSENTLAAMYVDMVKPAADDDMCFNRTYTVDWSHIENGFAEVSGFETETGCWRTVCRFYFDEKLYLRS